LTGVSATGQVGYVNIYYWAPITTNSIPNWTQIASTQTPNWTNINTG
jgi:hypothetical protein